MTVNVWLCAYIVLSCCGVFGLGNNVVIIGFNDQTVSVNETTKTEPPELDGASIRGIATNIGLYTYTLDVNSSITPQEFCDDLTKNDQDVALCEPDVTVGFDQSITPVPAVTNDPLSGMQWGLQAAGIPDAWSQGITGLGKVRVCIMDSGVDLTHPDLQQNIWTNPNEIAGDGVDNDNNYVIDDVHGSLVNGVIGSTANNKIGTAGVMWNVSLIQSKFMDATGNGALSDAVLAYNYCLGIKAHIIHNSWGSTEFSQALTTAFRAISTRAVPVITSAGNDGEDTDGDAHYPSGFSSLYPTVLSTGAIDETLAFASLSNYGPKSVQLAAPGISIEGPGLGGTYVIESGTSFAAPHVTGVAGLLYSWLQNNRSIDIDTQNVATLVTGAIANGTKSYPMSSDDGKSAHGILNFGLALQNLIDGLQAQNNQTTSIGGAAGIVIGLAIGIVGTAIVMIAGFFAYKHHRSSRD